MTSQDFTNAEIQSVRSIIKKIYTDIKDGRIQNLEKFKLRVNHTTREFRYMFDRSVPINTTPVTEVTLTIVDRTTRLGPLKVVFQNPTIEPVEEMILFAIFPNS